MDEPAPSTSKGVKRGVSPAQLAEVREEEKEDKESDLESRDSLDEFTDDDHDELCTRLAHAEDSSDESESQQPAVAVSSPSATSASDSDSSIEGESSPTERGSSFPSFRRASTSGFSRGASRRRGQTCYARGRTRICTGQHRGRVAYRPQPRQVRFEGDFVPPNRESPRIPEFSGNAGIKVNTENFEPVDYYQLFFTDSLIQHIVAETNRYGDQTLAAAERRGFRRRSRLLAWRNEKTTAEEMKRFVGLLLLTGIVRLPELSLYWSKIAIYACPIFAAIMPRNRFQLLLRLLHCNDSSKEPSRHDPRRDRLYKVRPLVDMLSASFQSVYKPGKYVAFDESLLLWKGALISRQHIPLKKAKSGVKIFRLCEDSGYTFRFHIYTGDQDSNFNINTAVRNDAHALPLSEKMVVYMMQPLLDQGYHLFMDSWHSGLKLYRYLYEKGTVCCGTICPNRLVRAVTELDVSERGEMKALRCAELLAVKWYSSKMVYLLSTMHDESTKQVTHRGRSTVNKPSCVVDYNSKMGAVDKADQMLEPYDATRKTYRWYKKVIIRLLQVALLNAFLLYKKDGGNESFLWFQGQVIFDLITTGFGDPAAAAASAVRSEEVARLTGRHLPCEAPKSPSGYQAKRCRVCHKRGIRRVTKVMCPDCPDQPGLCAVPCFRIYHTVKKL